MRFARMATLRVLPGLDELRVTSMPQVLEPQLRPWKLGATLFALMGVLAVIVAAVGVYSVISYAVSQRTHEMGLRIALGAQVADILRLIVGEGLRIIAVGIAIGLGLAFALGRLVASLLYGLSAHDTLVFASSAALLALVGALASLVPALRVARIDPGKALRAE
jgi:ABC-type antimicrobial peptide transport system permease subunit